MRRFRLLRATLLIAASTLWIPLIWSVPSTAADLTCLHRPLAPGAALPPESVAYLLERYPSGRLPTSDTCTSVLIRGDLVSGDAERLRAFAAANRPFLWQVTLISSGGLVEEGLRLGRVIRDNLLATRAPLAATAVPGRYPNVLAYTPGSGAIGEYRDLLGAGGLNSYEYICSGVGCHCASACFLAWAGGIERSGGALGVHRPAVTSTEFAATTISEAGRLYEILVSTISNYLIQMEIPERYISTMFNTPAQDIYWLASIFGDSVNEPSELEVVPSVEFWLYASCDPVTDAEEEWLGMAYYRQYIGQMTRYDEQIMEELERKRLDYNDCADRMIARERDRLL